MELVQEKETGGQRRESYSLLLVVLQWPKLGNLAKRNSLCGKAGVIGLLGRHLEFYLSALILRIPMDKIGLFSLF